MEAVMRKRLNWKKYGKKVRKQRRSAEYSAMASWRRHVTENIAELKRDFSAAFKDFKWGQ